MTGPATHLGVGWGGGQLCLPTVLGGVGEKWIVTGPATHLGGQLCRPTSVFPSPSVHIPTTVCSMYVLRAK